MQEINGLVLHLPLETKLKVINKAMQEWLSSYLGPSYIISVSVWPAQRVFSYMDHILWLATKAKEIAGRLGVSKGLSTAEGGRGHVTT